MVAGEDAAVPQVDDPLPRGDAASDVLGGRSLREAEVDRPRTGLVRRPHVRVVGREGVQAGDQLGNERLLVHAERGVAGHLLGERRRVADRRGGAAEGAEAMRRVDLRALGHIRGQPPHRGPLRLRERLGQLGAEQVGSTHAAEQHRAAGEHRDVLAAVVDGEADVVRRVSRSVEDAHEARSGLQLVLVVDLAGREGDRHAVRHHVLRSDHLRELEPAADVVVVEVGLQDVGCGPALGVQDLLDPIDVPLGIDDDRRVAAPDDVAAVAEVGGVDRYDVNRAHTWAFHA